MASNKLFCVGIVTKFRFSKIILLNAKFAEIANAL